MSATQRPGSRESAKVRRVLASVEFGVETQSVYGDADVVTVEYAPEGDRDDPAAHDVMMGACTEILARLADRGVAPALLRGVCRRADDTPVVWLVRREWAVAVKDGELSTGDVRTQILESTAAFDGGEPHGG